MLPQVSVAVMQAELLQTVQPGQYASFIAFVIWRQTSGCLIANNPDTYKMEGFLLHEQLGQDRQNGTVL